jgi:hypothetical protein
MVAVRFGAQGQAIFEIQISTVKKPGLEIGK